MFTIEECLDYYKERLEKIFLEKMIPMMKEDFLKPLPVKVAELEYFYHEIASMEKVLGLTAEEKEKIRTEILNQNKRIADLLPKWREFEREMVSETKKLF